jgi:hypothetical protein
MREPDGMPHCTRTPPHIVSVIIIPYKMRRWSPLCPLALRVMVEVSVTDALAAEDGRRS